MTRWPLWEYFIFGGFGAFCVYAAYAYFQDCMYLSASVMSVCASIGVAGVIARLVFHPMEVREDQVLFSSGLGRRKVARAQIGQIVERRSYSPILGKKAFVDDIIILDDTGKEFVVARLWEGKDRRGIREALRRQLPDVEFLTEHPES